MGNDIREMAKTVTSLKELMDKMAWASEEYNTVRRLLNAYLQEIRQHLPFEYPKAD